MASSRATIRHMNGDLDPSSRSPFTDEQKKQIGSIQTHNLLHNSAAERGGISGLSLPEGRGSITDCKVDELKAMVIARGGTVTGRDGKAIKKADLQRIVRAYLFVEKQNPKHTVYFNRSRTNNGIFANVDTSQRVDVPTMIDRLLQVDETEPSMFDL